MFLVWFILGLVICGPASIVVSTLSYPLFTLEPIAGWFMLVLVGIVTGIMVLFNKWPAERKEAWLGVLFSAFIGSGFIWCMASR